MSTKAGIGIIIVIIIIVLVSWWLVKAPKEAPVPTSTPEVSALSQPQAAQNTPVSADTPAKADGAASAQGAGATKKPINSKTVDGMNIEVTKEGTGEPIKNGQTAAMLYTGKLTDGTVFDASAKHGNQPFSFSLGAGQVIKGWDEGIVGMKVGEERTLTIPPELAYGASGIPGAIPPNATLVFDVTLVGIK